MFTKEGVKGTVKGTFQKWDSVREVKIGGKRATRCYLLITKDTELGEVNSPRLGLAQPSSPTPRWMSSGLGPKLPSDIGKYLVVDFFDDVTIDVIDQKAPH